MSRTRYATALLGLVSFPAAAQQPAGWQLGLMPSLNITQGWVDDELTTAEDTRYRLVPATKAPPVLLVQRNFSAGRFVRVSFTTVHLPATLDIDTRRGDTLTSNTLGFGARGQVLRLEAGRARAIGHSGRTRVLAAVGVGLLRAGTPGRSLSIPAAPSTGPASQQPWGATSQTLTRQRRYNGMWSTRLGLERELPWRDVLSLEAALNLGLAPVYSTRQQVEFQGASGPQLLGATTKTRGDFWEIGLSYRWQAQKKKLPPSPPAAERAAPVPWQPLPARGLYLTGGVRSGVALARQGRVGYRPSSTVTAVAAPVFAARLGYQWPAGWLAEAGPQTAYVTVFGTFDPTVNAPASRGSFEHSTYQLAPQHGPELTGWPLGTAWALMGGRRWALRPNRWYAAAKAGVAVHRYTGPGSFGYSERLVESTPTQDYSEFSLTHILPSRWRVLGQVEADIEARISRRTLLGLQLAYAVRPVGRERADRLVVSWYRNGQEQVPVVAYSRLASATVGLQLRRVLHL